MTTECIYALKDKTIDEAKEFCIYINALAIRKEEEVMPTYISKVLKDIYVTTDYDGFGTMFKLKKDTIIVWAYGKDYCMHRLRPGKGSRKCFPYAMNKDLNGLFEDLFLCDITDNGINFKKCE